MDEKRVIISSVKETEISIYNYIDMEGIKNYLAYYPHLLVIIEFLILHIDDYVKNEKNKYIHQNINKSSHL